MFFADLRRPFDVVEAAGEDAGHFGHVFAGYEIARVDASAGEQRLLVVRFVALPFAWRGCRVFHDVEQGALGDVRHGCDRLRAAFSVVFRECEAQLVADELQVAEQGASVWHFAGFVVDQPYLFAAVCGTAVFKTVDSARQAYGEPVAHAGFRPAVDERAHDGDEFVAGDRSVAVDGVVGVEDVVEVESRGELPFRFGMVQCSHGDVFGVVRRVSRTVRLDEICGDVAQCDRRLRVLAERLVPFLGVVDGVEVAT